MSDNGVYETHRFQLLELPQQHRRQLCSPARLHRLGCTGGFAHNHVPVGPSAGSACVGWDPQSNIQCMNAFPETSYWAAISKQQVARKNEAASLLAWMDDARLSAAIKTGQLRLHKLRKAGRRKGEARMLIFNKTLVRVSLVTEFDPEFQSRLESARKL